jgi:tetrahydrodipicolinate N-succinyltransferase
MENYLSKSNCWFFDFSDTNTLLVENQIEKILIKIESKFKEIQYIKSIKIERINDNEFINVDENNRNFKQMN